MTSEMKEETLLKKAYYYENCSGCRIEKRNQTQKSIPFKTLFSIWIIVLCSSLPISSLFPFLYFMIRDFHITEREEDTSYYAVYWGVIADRYGRKPVIIMGTIAVIVFNVLFGLSVNFWMAIVTRFLLGGLNGLMGPIRAYATEVCREEHQAIGLSVISSSWNIGLIIGPALGGWLAQPAEKYPNIFSKESIFGRFPYFLPCLIISIFVVGVTISTFWLEESIHTHPKTPQNDESYAFLESATKESSQEYEEVPPISKQSLFKNWPLMSSLVVYCIYAFHDMACGEIFSLWAVSPRSLGGLGYSTNDVGQILCITDNFNTSVTDLSFPGASLRAEPFVVGELRIHDQERSDQDQRGAANGLSMTVMSLAKTIGPACGGALLSWAQKRRNASFLPGTHMVFFLLNVTQFIGFVLTFKPFLSLR
ncbi:hypothetical protein V2J09_013523 [Rumex salicifolius]